MTSDSWWSIHPGFDEAMRLPAGSPGIVERDLPGWFLHLDDCMQAELLRRRWLQLCVWASDVGVNRVVARRYEEGDERTLEVLGFRFVDDRGAKVRLEFDDHPATIRETLEKLFDISTIDLELYVGPSLRAAVLDQSWDAMYVIDGGRPAFPDVARDVR